MFPRKSSICFLSIIIMNMSDMTCIDITLLVICSTARLHAIIHTVKCDQPIYKKDLTIINNEPIDSPLKMVLRLWWFHLDIWFLEEGPCIDHIMQSSGLYEIQKTVSTTNTVEHQLQHVQCNWKACGTRC